MRGRSLCTAVVDTAEGSTAAPPTPVASVAGSGVVRWGVAAVAGPGSASELAGAGWAGAAGVVVGWVAVVGGGVAGIVLGVVVEVVVGVAAGGMAAGLAVDVSAD
jgi:hypothetical protein